MSDTPLDLASPAPTDAVPPVAAPAAPAEVTSDLVLVPPAPVPAVTAPQAASMMPISADRSAELAARAKSFVDGLAAMDPRAPEFTKKVDDVTSMGTDDIRAAAAVTNSMLQRPLSALAAAKGQGDAADPQRQVAKTLVDLRLQVEDLDPAQAQGGLKAF